MDLNAIYRRTVFRINDFFKGSPIRKPYKEVKFIQEHSYEESLPIRAKALHDLMDHARKNTSYYKNISGYNPSSFPIMNKASLLEHIDEIKVGESKIPGRQGPIHIQTSSGSTGTPFKIPQDARKRNRRVAEFK